MQNAVDKLQVQTQVLPTTLAINTPFALGAPLLYVELVYFLRGGNSSFRGLGQY
eukprot:COSAG02_NODE_31493_length_532_cov_2.198614_1_plen_53_part_01